MFESTSCLPAGLNDSIAGYPMKVAAIQTGTFASRNAF
jgi:hypothetical protein